MSFSVFDHPFLSELFGNDEEFRCLFSAQADIAEMLKFEVALAESQAEMGLIPAEAAKAIKEAVDKFKPSASSFLKNTARDGVIIPSLMSELRLFVGSHYGNYVHFGATSQDVIDTSLVLRLKKACSILEARTQTLLTHFSVLENVFGKNTMMGYTRMQQAIPIRVSDRISSWEKPLTEYVQKLRVFNFPLQFGGAAGTLEKFTDPKSIKLRSILAKKLKLHDRVQWHSQRAFIVELGSLISLITGTLGKFGQDIAIMAELGGIIAIDGGGKSSAMPHKQNPVAAETLITLSRFNALQISGLHQAMIHEQERSGSAWMLEWMILPTMLAATAGSLNIASNITQSILQIGQPDNL